jgi:pyruvate ferredoxin oxidoreductase beta subunit
MIATDPHAPSMNAASDKDPFNNNCYGTLVDREYKPVELKSAMSLTVLDVNDFNDRIIRGYEEGYGEKELPADLTLARSLIPAGTASLRDFSYIAPEIPEYKPENCTGCMDCVTECPDTAILGKVLGEDEWNEKLQSIPEPIARCSRRSGRAPRSTTTPGRRSRASAGCSTSLSTRRSARGAPSA